VQFYLMVPLIRILNTVKGFDRGVPLSSYLFLLVAEGLNKILIKGIELGNFEGLGPRFFVNRNVLNLQYADDIILFLKADYMMVERLKWALQVFEGISSLKINFMKSELIPLNIDTSMAHNFATQLNYRLGSLPMKYLGLSLHWKKPTRIEWQSIIDKIQSRLPT
jgi:Reverse transcriptase (RNA-dependent DNA polymerase)